MITKRETTWSVEGPFEDQIRLSTGERQSLREAIEASKEFTKDIDSRKLRLVKTTTMVTHEFLPYDDALGSD